MIIVDSSVWIDYFNGQISPQTDKLDALLGTDLITVGDLIIMEVLRGFKKRRDYELARDALSKLNYVDMVGQDIAVRAAEHYRSLRSKGITVRKSIDMMIGTYCIVNNYELLHNDRDFIPMVTELGLKEVL